MRYVVKGFVAGRETAGEDQLDTARRALDPIPTVRISSARPVQIAATVWP